jgi:hypothetical protein
MNNNNCSPAPLQIYLTPGSPGMTWIWVALPCHGTKICNDLLFMAAVPNSNGASCSFESSSRTLSNAASAHSSRFVGQGIFGSCSYRGNSLIYGPPAHLHRRDISVMSFTCFARQDACW